VTRGEDIILHLDYGIDGNLYNQFVCGNAATRVEDTILYLDHETRLPVCIALLDIGLKYEIVEDDVKAMLS